jgi:ankyrin repeat protein
MTVVSFAPHTFDLVTEIIESRCKDNGRCEDLNDGSHNMIPPSNDVLETEESDLNYQYSDDEDESSCLVMPPFNSPQTANMSSEVDSEHDGIVDPVQLTLKNCDGETPFLVASKTCNISAMKLLLTGSETLSNVNIQDNFGRSAMHNVCENKHVNSHHEALRYLLKHGAEVNVQNIHGQTPLHITVTQGCLECTQQLLKHGACPRIVDGNGNTPLHIVAASHDQLPLIRALSSGCGSNCSHCGIRNANGEMIASIPENLRQLTELASMDTTFYSTVPDTNDFVQPNEKSLEIWDAFFQNMRAESSSSSSHISSVEIMSDTSAMPLGTDDEGTPLTGIYTDGNTDLHQAALRGDIDKLRALLEQGAPTNARNNTHQSALGICFEKGFHEGSNLILEYKHGMSDQEDNFVNQSVLDNESLPFHLANWACSFLKSFFMHLFNPAIQIIESIVCFKKA